jgi:hypothetical protein
MGKLQKSSSKKGVSGIEKVGYGSVSSHFYVKKRTPKFEPIRSLQK